jgi:hypothetical protein
MEFRKAANGIGWRHVLCVRGLIAFTLGIGLLYGFPTIHPAHEITLSGRNPWMLG